MYAIRLGAISCAALVCCAAQAQTVVVNDNISSNSQTDTENAIFFRISKYVEHGPGSLCYLAGCETHASFVYDGQTLTPDTLTLDEISDWYLVQPGDAYSDVTIQAGRFPILLEVTPEINGNTLTVGAGEFYLGVRTGAGSTNGRPNRTA